MVCCRSYPRDEEADGFTKPFSESTAQVRHLAAQCSQPVLLSRVVVLQSIDEEVQELVRNAYARTVALVETHKEKVRALAEKLIEVETVNHDMLLSILGKRPFTSDAYMEFLKNSKSCEPWLLSCRCQSRVCRSVSDPLVCPDDKDQPKEEDSKPKKADKPAEPEASGPVLSPA